MIGASDQDRHWLFGIDHSKALQLSRPTEPLVCGNEEGSKASTLEPARHGQLQRIKRAQAVIATVFDDEQLGDLEVFITDGSHPNMASPEIGFQPLARYQSRLLIDLASSDFQGEYRFHLDECEPRDDSLCAGIGKQLLDDVATRFTPVVFR
jgi:hypothetical protein